MTPADYPIIIMASPSLNGNEPQFMGGWAFSEPHSLESITRVAAMALVNSIGPKEFYQGDTVDMTAVGVIEGTQDVLFTGKGCSRVSYKDDLRVENTPIRDRKFGEQYYSRMKTVL